MYVALDLQKRERASFLHAPYPLPPPSTWSNMSRCMFRSFRDTKAPDPIEICVAAGALNMDTIVPYVCRLSASATAPPVSRGTHRGAQVLASHLREQVFVFERHQTVQPCLRLLLEAYPGAPNSTCAVLCPIRRACIRVHVQAGG